MSGLSLSIKPGSVCAFVGPSGGGAPRSFHFQTSHHLRSPLVNPHLAFFCAAPGKSTLVHLLLRFYDPRRGRILLDGVDLKDINLVSLHQSTAIVAQDTELFQGTVRENITYGLAETEFDEARIHEAARLANAHDFIMSFEDKYETRVGQRGVRLSGGQKQRIRCARRDVLRCADLASH